MGLNLSRYWCCHYNKRYIPNVITYNLYICIICLHIKKRIRPNLFTYTNSNSRCALYYDSQDNIAYYGKKNSFQHSYILQKPHKWSKQFIYCLHSKQQEGK